MALLRSEIGRERKVRKAASAAWTASSAVAKQPRLPAARGLPLDGTAPLPICDSTCWTTLRIRSSVICMADTVALRVPTPLLVSLARLGLLGLAARREDDPTADVDRVDQADHHGVDRELLGLG